MTDHDISTRERRFAETVAQINAAMREFVVLIEEQVTAVNAPHQIAMLELMVDIKQIRRDVDRLDQDVTHLAETLDRLMTHHGGST